MGNKESAKKRVQKLKAAGYILEKRRKAYEPSILFLSKCGFECIRANGELPEGFKSAASFSKRAAISELTLRHELEVLDVKVAFHQAVKDRENFSLAEFSTWPRLYEFSVRDPDKWNGTETKVKPDSFMRIHENDAEASTWEHLFFVEVDRSTEKLDTFVERLRLYPLFYRSGGMAVRLGKTAEDYEDFPFRVLVVCKSPERRNNIIQKLLELKPPILTQILLSTLPEVCADPLAAIWRMPVDHGEAAISLLCD